VRELTQASHKLAESLYKATASQPGEGSSPDGGTPPADGAAGPGKGDGDVIDAEVVDKK
jgi:hypothetical protein